MWSFIKICLICIIGKNLLKEKFHRKTGIYVKLLLAMYLFCVLAAVKNLSSFWLKLKQQWTIEEISIFILTAAILNGGRSCWTQFWKGPTQGVHTCQVRFNLVQRFQRRRFKCESLGRTDDGRQVMTKAHMAFGQAS